MTYYKGDIALKESPDLSWFEKKGFNLEISKCA